MGKIVAGMAALLIAGALAPAWAGEAPYPARSVRVLVGLAPGGGTDTVARVITQRLSDALGQTFVVDNRPSAGGNVAGELAAPAKTPRPIIEVLNSSINRALPELRERYETLGLEIAGGPAADFGVFLVSERDKWAQVVKLSGAKVE